MACTSKLCSSPAKLLSALTDRLSSDWAVFNTTQPAFVTLLCRRENLTSRDLALRDNFPQISSLTFGTTTFFQFSGLKYWPVVSLYWSSPSFFNQQAFATSANFLFTGSEVRSCESSDFSRLSSNYSWLDSSPSVFLLSSEPNRFLTADKTRSAGSFSAVFAALLAGSAVWLPWSALTT